MHAPRTPLLLSRPFVVLGLVVAFLLAAGTALLSTFSAHEVARAGERASATQATLLQINQLLSSLTDAETGQRGYILTGDEHYLEPYIQATARLGDQLARLRERLASSPEQLVTLARISDLVAAKQAELRRTIDLRRVEQSGRALAIVDSGAGLATMNAFRDAVRELERRELAALSENSAAITRRAAFFQNTGVAVLLAACVLAALGALVVSRRLHEFEDLVTVCAWTKRVRFNGAWVSFEDYLRARFNLRFTHGISEDAAKKLEVDLPPQAVAPSPARETTPAKPHTPAAQAPRSVHYTPPYPAPGGRHGSPTAA